MPPESAQGTEERGVGTEGQDEDTLRERRFFTVVLVLGAAALFFGILHLLNTIRLPFSGAEEQPQTASLGEVGQEISQLRGRDTDGDGLNDYNELYQYQTSPYLGDSDSDGKNDAEEVGAGTDPNCAAGTDCSSLAQTANLANATTNETSLTAPESAGELRDALRKAGAPAATLDALSDAELLQLYQDTLTESGDGSTITNALSGTQGNATAPASNAAVTEAPDVADLQNLSAADIRQLLVDSGADAESVNSVDDATLRQIFLEALGESSNSTSASGRNTQ